MAYMPRLRAVSCWSAREILRDPPEGSERCKSSDSIWT